MSGRIGSRNARRGLIYFRPCPGCGRGEPLYLRLDDTGSPVGDRIALRHHCRSCHRPGHRACKRCGGCLPESGPGGLVRGDRRFYSNACRQAAYRRRRDGR